MWVPILSAAKRGKYKFLLALVLPLFLLIASS